MRIQKLDENSRKNLLEDLLKRSPNNYGQYEQGVTEILANVKANGDQALFEYTKKFDQADLNAGNIKVTDAEIEELIREMEKMFSEEGYEKTYQWAVNTINEYPNCVLIMKNSVRQAGLTANRTERSLDRK